MCIHAILKRLTHHTYTTNVPSKHAITRTHANMSFHARTHNTHTSRKVPIQANNASMIESNTRTHKHTHTHTHTKGSYLVIHTCTYVGELTTRHKSRRIYTKTSGHT